MQPRAGIALLPLLALLLVSAALVYAALVPAPERSLAWPPDWHCQRFAESAEVCFKDRLP